MPGRGARCRTASSRSAARATARRPSSDESRRRRRRAYRRAPSRPASSSPSRARRCAAGARARSAAGTWARGRTLPTPGRTAASRHAPHRDDRAVERLAGRRELCAAPQCLDDHVRLLSDVVSPFLVDVRDRDEDLAKGREPVPRLGRVVRAAEERRAVRGEEDGHRPAALTGEGDDRVHVQRIDVRTFLAVDLDADEQVVHKPGRFVVLERLVLHHVAPVACGVADGEEHRLVLFARARERLVAPWVPVDRVVGGLQEVRPRLAGEAIHHPTLTRPWHTRSVPAVVPWIPASPPALVRPALAPACKAANLRVSRSPIFTNGLAGSGFAGSILVRNAGPPCSLLGTPKLRFVGGPSARVHLQQQALTKDIAPAVDPLAPPFSMRAVPTGSTVWLPVAWRSWCAPGPPTSFEVDLPSAGGTLRFFPG